jgi:hypothetical protein
MPPSCLYSIEKKMAPHSARPRESFSDYNQWGEGGGFKMGKGYFKENNFFDL